MQSSTASSLGAAGADAAAPAQPTAAAPLRQHGWRRSLRRFCRNRLALVGAVTLLLMLVVALLAPWIAPYPDDISDAVNFDVLLQPPSWSHWMGTDEAGRDVLTRVMYGTRLSFMMVAIALTIAVCIGVPVGLVAGYFGGWIEQLLLRITDVFSAVPALVLALAITVVLGPSLGNAMLALGLVWWRGFARIAHGRTLSIKEENFVTVARTLGASHGYIMFREILPNISSALLVSVSINAGYAILVGTSLSFLGAGASPPAAEWGLMVATSRHYLPDAWWASLFPGLAIFIAVMSFNLLGDGLRDVLGEDA